MKTKLLQLTALFASLALFLTLTACAGTTDAPAQTAELYYQALVDKDQDTLVNLSCAAYEASSLMTLDSFGNVDASLVDLACQTVEEDDSQSIVTCEGAISATYDGEAREFPLSGQNIIVVLEGGEWRMCGSE
jgi:hypothetical protein